LNQFIVGDLETTLLTPHISQKIIHELIFFFRINTYKVILEGGKCSCKFFLGGGLKTLTLDFCSSPGTKHSHPAAIPKMLLR